ncbi:MAG: hypothetical protein AAF514_18675, partial [Verrucomicrobiota bacterium]
VDPVLRPGQYSGQPIEKSIALLALEEQELFSLVLAKQLQAAGFATSTAAFGEEGAIILRLVPEENEGTVTWCLAPRGAPDTDSGELSESVFEGNRRDADNISLATAIHAQVLKSTGHRDGGIRRLRSHTLQGAKGPAIQITVPDFETEAAEEKAALAITQGLERFHKARSESGPE